MDVFAASESERPEEPDHWLETVVAHGSVNPQILVPSDTEHRGERSSVGSHHIIIYVPCPNPQGTPAIHLRPWVGSLEAGEVQQSLIDNGNGVGHRPAGLFADADGKFFLRAYRLRKRKHRVKPRIRSGDRERLNAVETKRLPLGRPAIWIEKSHVHIA